MSQKDQDPPDDEGELPSNCPICSEVVEKLVLHISRNKSCLSNIDLYNKWKPISKKRSKRKYQERYVDTGKHQIAQNKYEKNKFKQRQDKWGTWTYENEEERESYLFMKRHKQSKYQNRKDNES